MQPHGKQRTKRCSSHQCSENEEWGPTTSFVMWRQKIWTLCDIVYSVTNNCALFGLCNLCYEYTRSDSESSSAESHTKGNQPSKELTTLFIHLSSSLISTSSHPHSSRSQKTFQPWNGVQFLQGIIEEDAQRNMMDSTALCRLQLDELKISFQWCIAVLTGQKELLSSLHCSFIWKKMHAPHMTSTGKASAGNCR